MNQVEMKLNDIIELKKIMELLVKYGADVNQNYSSPSGWTVSPLFFSVAVFPLDSLDFVKTLVEKGADINFKAKRFYWLKIHDSQCESHIFSDFMTPLDVAKKRGSTEIVEYLKGKGAKSAKSAA